MKTNAAADQLMAQLERALDVMSRRQQLIASNVANIDTPDYRTVDVDFSKALDQAMQGGDDGLGMRRSRADHLASAGSLTQRGLAEELDGLAVRPDGNNVSLDREMLAIAETRHRYDTATTLLRTRLRQLRAAISEGRTA